MTRPAFGPPASSGEWERVAEILSGAFHLPAETWELWFGRVGRENVRVLRRSGRVVAVLGIHRFRAFYFGRPVPAGGIAAVGVPPESRGAGVAAELMTRAIREMREDGTPTSILYASTQRLYRRVGYEQAGTHFRWSIPLGALLPGSRDLELRAADPDDLETLGPLRSRWVALGHGETDRPAVFWRDMKPPGEPAYAYVVGPEDAPEGYVFYYQARNPVGGHDLRVGDLVALTPAALARIWTFFADHRSLARHVHWRAGPDDPSLLHLPEQTWRPEEALRWMLRIHDPVAALTARGWPVGVGGEVHFEIADATIPENAGRCVLRVADGRAEVEPDAGRGDLKLDVRALAPLYTGLHSASALRRAGRIDASAAAAASADALFASPHPSLSDRF